MKSYRYLDLITAVFITALLTSNLVASKTAVLFSQTIGVAPPAAGFKNQDAFHTILGQSPFTLSD